jgi:hypothetical protein
VVAPLYIIINCVQNARVFSVAQLKQQEISLLLEP